MAIKEGRLVFQDFTGKQATMTIKNCNGLGDTENFGETIQKYSRAKLISATYSQTTLYDNNDEDWGEILSTQSGEHYDTVEQKAKFIFRDADGGAMIILNIPAPNDNVFQSNQQPKSDVAEDIADAYASATSSESMDLMYKGGGLISKVPASDRRIKQYSGV